MTALADRRGSTYVEFLIVFLPVLVLLLCIVQSALIYLGRVMVERAAENAARAAIVVLDDDPRCYGGAERNQVAGGGTRSIDPMQRYLAFLDLGESGSLGSSTPRLADIRDAASMSLLGIAPPLRPLVGSQDVYDAIGANLGIRNAEGAALYNRAAVAVTFPASPTATSYRSSFALEDQVTVRVTYLFHCSVPIVRYLLCESIDSLRGGTSYDAARQFQRIASDPSASALERALAWQALTVRRARAEAWHPAVRELEQAEAAGLSDLTSLTRARFFVLRAESRLPNQGARYEYAGEPTCAGGGRITAWGKP